MFRKITLLIVGMILYSGSIVFAGKDTFSVFFRSNESILTEGIQRQLDNALYNGTLTDKDGIVLVGYADEVGGEAENLRLSRARAAAVKAYLIQSGFRSNQITLIEGKGKLGSRATPDGAGFPRDRRVDIVKAEVNIAEAAAVPNVPESPKPPVAAPHAPKAPESPAAAPLAPTSIDVSTIPLGEPFRLDNIYFEGGTHEFKSGSYPTLDALVRSLKQHPNVRIRIEGHVCCTKGDADGLDEQTHKNELSVTRANAVRNYLIKKGIAPSRLEYEGMGRRVPVYPIEHTEDEAQANRRVEIRIL